MKPRIVLVAAVARGGVIGRSDTLPWHIPEDMAHFRELTRGAPVVMGRKTWDSLPARFRPLPGRRNLVVTRQRDWQAPGAEVVHGLPEALDRAAEPAPPGGRVFVIGGAEIYAAALPVADELALTEIDHPFEGDAHFPAWPAGDFERVERSTVTTAAPNGFPIHFVLWRRRADRPTQAPA